MFETNGYNLNNQSIITLELWIKQGVVSQFNYNGGADPGSMRYILMTIATNSTIGGYDFVRKAYRNFSRDKVSNFGVLIYPHPNNKNFKKLDMQNVPVGSTGIVDGYEKLGMSAWYSQVLNTVFALRIPESQHSVESNNGYFGIRDEKNHFVSFGVDYLNRPFVQHNAKCEVNPTAERMLELINKVMSK